MMRDEICTYGVCKLAKEKGFNLPSYFYYHRKELSNDGYSCCHNKGVNYVCAAPTQSLLQRWLREKKNIHISIDYQQGVDEECPSYNYSVYQWPINTDAFVSEEWKDGYSTYELALEDALKYALENLV